MGRGGSLLAGNRGYIAQTAALEQHHAQTLFDRTEPPEHGRMVDAELPCRTGKCSRIGDSADDPQVIPGEARVHLRKLFLRGLPISLQQG